MILVAGSTGLLGSEICRQLTAQQKQVKALVRKTSSREKIGALEAMGCTLVMGDLKDKATLTEACKGCDVVISTVSTTLSRQEGDSIQSVDLEGHLDLVAAAKEAGVKQFIFISFRHHKYEFESALTIAKRSTEQSMKNSGMNYTILQCSFFMEIWLSPMLGFNFPEHKVLIPGPGNSPISFVSYKDVAAFATGSVNNPAAQNQVLEIGGPEALTPLQVVETFENVSGHPFLVQQIPVEVLEQQMQHDPDFWNRVFATMMLCYSIGDSMDMKPALGKIPVKLYSVWDYANSVTSKEVMTM